VDANRLCPAHAARLAVIVGHGAHRREALTAHALAAALGGEGKPGSDEYMITHETGFGMMLPPHRSNEPAVARDRALAAAPVRLRCGCGRVLALDYIDAPRPCGCRPNDPGDRASQAGWPAT
jgi:hypothetical protein